MDDAYIDFNMKCVDDLREQLLDNLEFIKRELPRDLNPNSTMQVKVYVRNVLDITLENVTITHLQEHLARFDHDSPQFDLLNGLIQFYKLKFTLTNYVDCVLRHHDNGRVMLRHHEGEWVLPNKRPLSTSPEIKGCIKASHIPKEKKHGSDFAW